MNKDLHSDWGVYFEYNGTDLINRITRNSRALKGAVAGNLGNRGYLVIRLNYKPYQVHRIIWELHHNKIIPLGMQIDHINGKRTDNRIENLRVVSNAENRKNQKMRVDNRSGYNGISKLGNVWHVRIGVNSKTIHLGNYPTLETAITARKNAEIAYNFHSNHGEERSC